MNMNSIQLDESIFLEPEFNEKESAWIEHIPFAFWISKVLTPSTFVELGTHNGTSYFSFCQAFDEFSIPCSAFAVDHWKGDKQAGFYDSNVYSYVSEVNKKHFGEISTLLKMSFDEAKEKFDNNLIDLLHIDGMHSYDEVAHDFYNWLPKLSNRGVVLLHDTQVKKEGFGVWKLFDELAKKYPTFEFKHGYGLGIVCVGEEVKREWLDFVSNHKNDSFIHHLFESLGKKLLLEFRLKQLKKTVKHQKLGVAQLFYSQQRESFSESKSIVVPLHENQSRVCFKFEEAVEITNLRFDPINDYSHIQLQSFHFFKDGREFDVALKISTNGKELNNSEYLFLTPDPQVHIDFSGKESLMFDEVLVEITYLEKGKDIIPILRKS